MSNEDTLPDVDELLDLEFGKSDNRFCHLAWRGDPVPGLAACGAWKDHFCNPDGKWFFARQFPDKCEGCGRTTCPKCLTAEDWQN